MHRLASAYVKSVARHNAKALLLVLAVLAVGLAISSGLKLRSDLKELLPQNYESVRELNRVLQRVGGVGSLIVVAQSPNVDANKRFMDDLAARLYALPPGYVRYVDYKADEIRKFYETHFLYYIDAADLELLYDRLKKRVDYEKFRRSPFFFSLEEEEDDSIGIKFDDIRERNEAKFEAPVSTVGDYYGGEWGRMLVMVIRPYGADITFDSARDLIAKVEEVVAGLNPGSYDGRMNIGYCGNVKSTIEEYETLRHDIASTAFLCVMLVAAAIFVYFLRIRVIFLLGAALIVAIAWTFAITRLVIGYLNSQTAFLGSIIVGTGINYGIIIMARYIEERKKRREIVDAMAVAIDMTLKPTFLAAGTTAVAFVVLLIARIQGLSQFGFIGALGVILCWFSAILILPILVFASERITNLVKPRPVPQRKSALFQIATKLAARSPIFILVIAFVSLAVSVVAIWRFAPDSIEYDFTKLRNRVSVSRGTEALERQVSRLFKDSMTPSVVLVDSMEDGREVCAAVERQNNEYHPDDRRVGTCRNIYDLLPTDQDAKMPVMEKIEGLLSGSWTEKLKGDLRENIERVKGSILGRPLTVDDLPLALTRHFEDLRGNRGAVVFISPRPGMLLSDGRNLIRFADTIRDIRLSDGRMMHAASASIIFSDLIKIIKSEAPYLTFASLLGVILFVAIVLRRTRLSAEIIIGLVWAVVIMVGIAAYMDIKINFFNFIVLPLTFGIGVDYSLNVAMRIRQEGPDGVVNAIRQTGIAVVLCSVTTMIGYFVLTAANNQALVTFGIGAVIGEITCLVAAILVVPAMVVLIDKWKGR